MSDFPRLRVASLVPEVALAPEVLAELGATALPAYLAGRRWFGAKGQHLRTVRVRDVVPLFADDPPSGVARLDVDVGAPLPWTCQLPLALRPPGVDVAPLAVLETPGGERLLFDAVEDPGFRQRLGRTFREGVAFGTAARWVVEAIDDEGRRSIPEDAIAELGRAEQSNTSIRYGQRAILKLFRRLEPGENPDTEIGRFLATRTSFRHVPRLFGTIHFVDRDGSTSVAGMLQAFVAGSRDGWAYTLDRLRAELAGRTTRTFFADAHRLGEVTRGLHEALASDRSDPDFGPDTVGGNDVRAWAAGIRAQAARSLDLLAKNPGAAPRSLLARRSEIDATISLLAERIGCDAGAKIRHHGDYHLGQVLRTADDDFVVIDFEGEPARPLAERRRRHSPLRDVAGMLRSFDYAAATVVREASSSAPRVRAWRDASRTAFLRGYREPLASSVLPRSETSFDALRSLFELEKALYEVAYELNNRPDWVDIALSGVETVLEASRSS